MLEKRKPSSTSVKKMDNSVTIRHLWHITKVVFFSWENVDIIIELFFISAVVRNILLIYFWEGTYYADIIIFPI